MSLAQSWSVLLLGLLLIRIFGQGAMGLASSTATAARFEQYRGQALSLVGLGHPIGSAVFPVLVSFWVSRYDWRSGWVFLALLTLLMFLPTVLYLLRSEAGLRARPNKKQAKRRSKAIYGMLLTDPKFFPAVFAGIAPPCFLTALFLYQVALGESKGWSVALMASAFIPFSLARAVFVFVYGRFIDVYSASRVFAVLLVPLVLGLGCLWFGESPVWVFISFTLFGVTVGGGMTVRPAFWAENYGAERLGTVQGLVGFFTILSTALGPWAMGHLIDAGVGFQEVLRGMIVLTLGGAVLCTWVSWRALKDLGIRSG